VDISLSFRNETTGTGSGQVHAKGRIAQPLTEGAIQVDAEWTGRSPQNSTGNVNVALDRFPVDAINPRLRHLLKDRRLDGQATAKLTVTWQPQEAGGTASETDLKASEIQLRLSGV